MSSSALTDQDKKFWPPIPQVVAYVANQIPAGAKVLEVGPGDVPFSRATHWVDFVARPNLPNVSVADLSSDPLPFADKEFQFCYARHVLEDMHDPFPLIKEMQRVAHAGYIEMPSPIAELTRGVDGSSPPYRGYHHHRFMGWMHEAEFRLISKYPFVEYLRFHEDRQTGWLREGPKYWNTYYLWKDKINWVHRQNTLDYLLPRDYSSILNGAMESAKRSVDVFWQDIPEKMEIAQRGLSDSAAA